MKFIENVFCESYKRYTPSFAALTLLLLGLTACGSSASSAPAILETAVASTDAKLPENFPPQIFSQQLISNGNRMLLVDSSAGSQDIWVTNIDGSATPVNLTDQLANDYNPAWSPNGLTIAFVSERDNNPEIYVMNADGSEQTRLTNNGVSDTLPVWSPDGQYIAFVSNRDNNSEIYIMTSDGKTQTRVTENTAFDTRPTWSLDGTQIAYISAGTESLAKAMVYVINPDGTGQMSYIDFAIPNRLVLRFDPDGRKKNCSAFQSQVEAQLFFIAAGGPLSDRHELDGDGDGIACASLP